MMTDGTGGAHNSPGHVIISSDEVCEKGRGKVVFQALGMPFEIRADQSEKRQGGG